MQESVKPFGSMTDKIMIEMINFGHRLYSASELSNLMQDCGFTKVHIFGDLSGSPYDNNAQRLVVKAEK